MNSEQMTIKEVKGEGYEGNERVFNFHHRYIHFALEIEFDEHFWIFTSFFFFKFGPLLAPINSFFVIQAKLK